MNFEIDELAAVFSTYNFKAKKTDDNFFAIGTRGFYENPFTEVLAYLLNSTSQFNGVLREKFIEILLGDIISKEECDSLIHYGRAYTQHCTYKKNYIDLVFYSDDCVVVFENKIFHDANNPFDDYVEDIKRKYTKASQKHYFILFSYKKQKVTNAISERWKYISIRDKFSAIAVAFPEEILNKWDYIAKDFFEHYSIITHDMDDKEIKFYQENFHKIIAAENGLNIYINQLAGNFAITNEIVNWHLSSSWDKETKAIRFYPLANQSNVVLIFNTDGSYSVSVYYYKDYYEHLSTIYPIVGNLYREWREGTVCCFTLDKVTFNTIDDTLAECKVQLDKMKKYLKENN